METRRQKQVAREIQLVMSDIFLKEGREITDGALVTIAGVNMTPDLLVAKIYFSIYNHSNPDEVMYYIESNKSQLRKLLGNKVGKHMRRVPELVFFKDDTLNEVFKLDQILKDLKKDQQQEEE
ncbi:MAG: 30S ribosome-binding factor RbfA [Bacteroidetes bacterium]|nr:30S ribosome-binding factor RbfA [Bacteroidota bacterium]